jgi:hypothetical protein
VTLSVVFSPLAEDEAVEAREWYESKRSGLGTEFAEAIDETVARIAENPFAYQRAHQEIRRAVLTRFPCAVITASPATISSSWLCMDDNTPHDGKSDDRALLAGTQ